MLHLLCRTIIISTLLLLSGCATDLGHWLPWSSSDTKDGTAENTTSDTLSIVWQHNVDYSKLGAVQGISQPALIELQDHSAALAVGGSDGYLRILALASGSELRRIALDEAVESGVLQLASGIVIVGDIVGNLYGIDPDAGTIRWRMRLSSFLLGTPVKIDGDAVLQTMDNRLYRINPKGKKIWSFDGYPGGISMHASPSPLVTDDHRVLAVLSAGDVVALNGSNGDLLWRKQLLLNANAAVLSELKAPIASPLMIKDLHYGIDHVTPALLVGLYQGELHLMQADSGEQRAARKLSLRATPLLDNDTLFLAAADGKLRALDTRHGEVLWKQSITEGELTGITVWHDQLWMGDNRGMVYRLSRNGHNLLQLSVPGMIDREPIATPQGVVVRTTLGGIYLIR
ncbi:MAG: PQQ-binding-like beta-propeller repeat protein [Mariprofundales bacterium]